MIVAVVLAAGMSKRMGKPKQLISVGGEPMLQKVIESLRSSKVDRVVVVLGAHHAEVGRRVKFRGEKVMVNDRYEEGMGGSLKLGLKGIAGEAEAAVIALGDQPFVKSGTIDALVDGYRASRARIVLPSYRGVRGNPVLFDRSMFPRIMEIQGDTGAKSVVAGNPASVLEVPVEDSGVLHDIDTPSDLSEAAPRKGATRSRKGRAQA